MMATLIKRAADRPGWLWEPKLDGIRSLVFIRDGRVELRRRRSLDTTRQYPALVRAMKRKGIRLLHCVTDVEIISNARTIAEIRKS